MSGRRRRDKRRDLRDCALSNGELAQLLTNDFDTPDALDELASLNILREEFEGVLAVCRTVREARAENNKYKEWDALPGCNRWGRKGESEPALTYAVANYLLARGFTAPRHLTRKERKRYMPYPSKSGGFAKPWNPSNMLQKRSRCPNIVSE